MKWRLYFGLILCAFTTSCSDSVHYTFGVITQEVNGVIEVQPEAKPLVLVRMQIATFAQTSQGQVQQARAKLVYPDLDGSYRVLLEDNVSQLELYFIAHGYQTAHANFERTLGVKSYQFNVKLETAPNPKGSYYHSLKPLLTQYIVEPRFQMPPKDQLALGAWMTEEENQLYPVPKKQP